MPLHEDEGAEEDDCHILDLGIPTLLGRTKLSVRKEYI
jgi:hypothetical protein